jgi:hypothetical protein
MIRVPACGFEVWLIQRETFQAAQILVWAVPPERRDSLRGTRRTTSHFIHSVLCFLKADAMDSSI